METKMLILLIEDDAALSGEIKQFLEKWGYQAKIAENFENIVSEFLSCQPHMVLMDINLPYYDGFYWCRKIREISNVPILYISSKNDDRDKIMAIAGGGDDYLEKPFHLELLKAKMDAVLRRTYQYKIKERVYLGEDIYFEKGTDFLFCFGKEVELTKSEKKVMEKLAEQKTKVVTREELMMELWGMDEFISDGTLTTLVSRLRNKLKACCGKELILTKKGQGYFIA